MDRKGRIHHSSDCGCAHPVPKANGTCATCGGWLPGERPPSPWPLVLTELNALGGALD